MRDNYLRKLLLVFQRVALESVIPGKPRDDITLKQLDEYIGRLGDETTENVLTLRYIDLLRLALRELMLHIRVHTWHNYGTLDQKAVIDQIEQTQNAASVEKEVATLKESMQNINAAFAVAFYQGHVNSNWLVAPL